MHKRKRRMKHSDLGGAKKQSSDDRGERRTTEINGIPNTTTKLGKATTNSRKYPRQNHPRNTTKSHLRTIRKQGTRTGSTHPEGHRDDMDMGTKTHCRHHQAMPKNRYTPENVESRQRSRPEKGEQKPDYNNPKAYRIICLLNCMGKMVEKVVATYYRKPSTTNYTKTNSGVEKDTQ
jgi:hypothetical protein